MKILSNKEATELVQKYRISGKHKDKDIHFNDKLPHDKYVIIDLPLSELDSDEVETLQSASNTERVDNYSKEPIKTPIYAYKTRRKNNWYVSDGGHRVMAAFKRGDKTIKAIVPLKDINVNESYKNNINELILYRGERKLKKQFNIKDNVESSLAKGIYMTDSIDLAKAYAVKYIYKCSVKLNNPLIFNWRTDEGRDKSVEIGKSIGLDVFAGNWIRGNGADKTKMIKNAGYDSLIVKQPSTDNYPEHLEVVIFDTNNIDILDVTEVNSKINESTKIAYHNTTKDSQDKILKYGAKASDRGWKGKGFYGYINDGGSEGKGNYKVFFDYSNLKTTDGSKPKEFTDKEWSVSRSDRDKYEKFLKNYDYDAEIDTSSSWIKVFPWSLHKLDFFVKDDIKENKFDTYIETIYEHLLQEKTLTLYHATRSEFEKFSNQYTISQMGVHLGNLEQAENVYEGYVEDYENGDSDKLPKILQVTATIKNPLALEDLGSWYGSLVKDMISKKLNKKLSSDRDSYLKKVIIDAGYDSVVYENKFEGDGLSYIIFNPEHINIIKTVKEYKN